MDYLIVNPELKNFSGGTIDNNNLPCISFCIPTLNNENTLYRCLSSIIQQDYPNIEIIIIDGYSKDRTLEIAREFTDKIYFDDIGYGSACQIGIERSTGSIVALFDSDIIIPHKDWLINAVRFFNYSDHVSSVWPMYEAPPQSSLFEKLYQTNIYKIIIEHRIINKKGYFGGGNTLFLKKCLQEIGGVNKSIHWGADFDWARRLKAKGYQVVYISDPLYHDTMRSLIEFSKKQFTGAKTFTKIGFSLTGLSKKDIIYEHFILGARGMFDGLIINKDISWAYFPLFLTIRVFAYIYIYLASSLKDLCSKR